MTLHEAIERVLLHANSPMTPRDIADEINKLDLYRRGDDEPLRGGQISARVKNYPLYFFKENGLVHLSNSKKFQASGINRETKSERRTGTKVKQMQKSEFPGVGYKPQFQGVLFKPNSDDPSVIPNAPGNYLICLRKKSTLPDISIKPIYNPYKGLEVIYTGIAGKSLRNRDYRQHFIGNAGNSTLRKSIGSLFGFEHIDRDSTPNNGKTTFNEKDENALSEWMRENLVLYYQAHRSPQLIESSLIKRYNPPLNLQGNNNPINKEYRVKLSALRKKQ